MWPFRAKPLLDDDVVDWMVNHVHWLMSRQTYRAAYASAGPLPISDRMPSRLAPLRALRTPAPAPF